MIIIDSSEFIKILVLLALALMSFHNALQQQPIQRRFKKLYKIIVLADYVLHINDSRRALLVWVTIESQSK